MNRFDRNHQLPQTNRLRWFVRFKKPSRLTDVLSLTISQVNLNILPYTEYKQTIRSLLDENNNIISRGAAYLK